MVIKIVLLFQIEKLNGDKDALVFLTEKFNGDKNAFLFQI